MTTFPVDHEAEVKELFEKSTVAIPGAGQIRAINLETFTHAIDQMMQKAYYYGRMEAMNTAEQIIDQAFRR